MKQLVRRALGCLDNPFIWQSSRSLFELTFGLYQRRFRLLESWGVLRDDPAVLDIGCGTGPYARITRGPYLGLDLEPKYIAYAQRRHREHANREFCCMDATQLVPGERRFGLAILVDILHHIPADDVVRLLQHVGRLTRGHVASFEPVKEQTNPIGGWIIDNDRGHFMRPRDELLSLYKQAGLEMLDNRELYLGPIRTWAVLCRGQQEASAARP
jgi:SAM-dependent methyltransferase